MEMKGKESLPLLSAVHAKRVLRIFGAIFGMLQHILLAIIFNSITRKKRLLKEQFSSAFREVIRSLH